MPGGESERDGGALVVTVQAAVLDREVHVPVHAAARWTSQVSIMTGRRLHHDSKYLLLSATKHTRN